MASKEEKLPPSSGPETMHSFFKKSSSSEDPGGKTGVLLNGEPASTPHEGLTYASIPNELADQNKDTIISCTITRIFACSQAAKDHLRRKNGR